MLLYDATIDIGRNTSNTSPFKIYSYLELDVS